MGFLLIIPVVGILFIGFVWFYINNDNKAKKKRNTAVVNIENQGADPISKNELKKRIGIVDIKNNIIKQKNGAMTVLLSVSTPDFELLTDKEQGVFEDTLMRFALSLNSGIKFFTTQTRTRIDEPIKNVESLIDLKDNSVPEKLKEYATRYRNSLKELESSKGTYVRKSYCAVFVSDLDGNEKKTREELNSRVYTVQTGIAGAGGRTNILTSDQAAQVFADILNKGKGISVSKLIDDGALELYTEGVGQYVYAEKENETAEEDDEKAVEAAERR